jgi:hypothetical protein
VPLKKRESEMEKDDNPILNLNESSPSIQTHLQIIQNVIERMSGHSASCKTWCVTLVSALLVLIADKGKPELMWLALLPTVIFCGLDVFYLAQEKGYRNSYNAFIRKLHAKKLTASDLYSMKPSKDQSNLQLEALTSYAIWGFYVPLVILAIIAVMLVGK